MKSVSAFAFFIAGLVVVTAPALAQDSTSTTSHAIRKAHVVKAARKSMHTRKPADREPSIAGLLATNFACELGDKLTIYRKPGDNQHLALRWHRHLHQMTRVRTTTGADRFEDVKLGLVWIGIPAKSMLLDSRKGRQLANECRDPEQEAALHARRRFASGSR